MINENIQSRRIAIIGSGNIGLRLMKEFRPMADELFAVSHQAMECNDADYIFDHHDKLPTDLDLYICSVQDSKIEAIAKSLKCEGGIVVHTAGSVPMEIFAPYFNKYGIIYPFQSIRKNHEPEVQEIPFLIEASDEETLYWIKDLCESTGNPCYNADSEARKHIHLAGVFASNFINALYGIAYEIVNNQALDPTLLVPLIKETALRLEHGYPREFQTGPAIRNDRKTMEEHLKILESNEVWKQAYSLISNIILKQNGHEQL